MNLVYDIIVFAALSIILVSSTPTAFADLLFEDDFSIDPELNGWTENFVVDVLDGINPLAPPHAGHGDEVIMEKNHFQPEPIGEEVRFFSINRIISTEGFENIQISLTAHQTSDAFEPADYLEISVDTNDDGIFESVLKDVEIWDGVEDQSTVDTGVPFGNLIPTSTGFIPLSNAADNNPSLNIKIEASFNSYREDYYLTEVEVIGDAIPPPPPPSPPVLSATDHYLGYKVKETKHTEKFQKLTVTLSDQFEMGKIYTVEKPQRLFNPVDKNQEGIIDEITHLLGYKIKAPKGEKFEKVTNVHVTNQFGELIIDVKKPKLLLVPSSKDLTETPDKLDSITVNHYKCYDVKKTKDTPKFKKQQVTLSDLNFGETKVFEVKKPKHLCTPVDKDGEGIIDKESHLMCYDLKKIKDEPKFKKRNVFTNNQFEPEDLEVKKEHQLCVPSIIDIL